MHLHRHLLRLCCSAGIVAASPVVMADTAVIQNPGSGTNRIEVIGNSARNVQVRCADGSRNTDVAGSKVNSVNLDGRALQGKTVIVTGRNSRDIHADADCKGSAGSNTNVNSVNIR